MANVRKMYSGCLEAKYYEFSGGDNRDLPLPSNKMRLLISGSRSYLGKDEHHFHRLVEQHRDRRANAGYPGQGILCGRFLTNLAQVPSRLWSPDVCELGDNQESFVIGGMPFRLEILRHAQW